MPAGIDMLLMVVLFGAVMYFVMIRPQQKRLKEQQEMFNSLQPRPGCSHLGCVRDHRARR